MTLNPPRILPVALLAFGLAAAPAPAPSPAPAPVAPAQLPGPEKVVAWLGAKLNLSEDQKRRLLPIIVDRRQRMQAIRQDPSLGTFRRRRQLREVFRETDGRIVALLDDTQKQQYAQLKAQVREQARQRKQHAAEADPDLEAF